MDDFANITAKLECPHKIIGPCLLINADCRDVLPMLAAGSVDAVVTDPPYGVALIGKKTKHTERTATQLYEDSERHLVENIIPRVCAWVASARRAVITPGTRHLSKYPPPTDLGGVYQPNGAGRGPWGFNCFHPVLYYGNSPTNHLGQKPTTVRATHWIVRETIDHPCPKPVEWMLWMVSMASIDGELVADPFMGSGTTGVACIRTGRRFIGIEIDPGYFKIARDRIRREWEQYQGGPMFAPKADDPALFDETTGAKLKPTS